MSTFKLGKAAQLQSKIIPAAYYHCKISELRHLQASKGDSANHFFTFTITYGPFKGLNVSWMVNDKAIGDETPIPSVVKPFNELVAVVTGVAPKGEDDVTGEWDIFQNQYVDAHIAPGPHWQSGETENQIKGFKPFSGTKE